MKSSSVLAVLAVLACATLLSSTGFTRTWLVAPDGTGDFTKVQLGINAAQVGDTVLVAHGTYVENLTITHDIQLLGNGWDSSIIDGSQHSCSVITVTEGVTRSTVIAGFGITGGRGTDVFSGVPYGGGILILNSEPTIHSNDIHDNTAFGVVNPRVGYGGGIACIGTNGVVYSPYIHGNSIRNNSAQRNGGGVSVTYYMAPLLLTNVIRNNIAMLGDGGGVEMRLLSGGAEVLRNVVADNVAEDHGGALYLTSTTTTMQFNVSVLGNTFVGNSANGGSSTGDTGGAIWCGDISAVIRNNTFLKNAGSVSVVGGGAIAISNRSSVEISRNIICLTVRSSGLACKPGTQITIVDNLFWSNVGGDGVGACAVLGKGNLFMDPLLCDHQTTDHPSLASNSPALILVEGYIGANGDAGCPATAQVDNVTWSSIKTMQFNRLNATVGAK